MLPGYMQGTPEELTQRAQQGRTVQRRSGAWSPALDALEAFSYQAPAYQNQSFADAAQADAPGPMSQWGKYDAVLQARGAQMPQAGQFLGRHGYQQQTPYSHTEHDGLGSTEDLIGQSRGGAPASALPGRGTQRASQGAFNALKGYYGR